MNSRTLWNDNWYFAKTELGVKWEDRQIWEAKMQPVDLPHDWLIYDTKNLYEDSIGWYRKNFAYAPDKTGNDDRVILRFEGGYMDSSIYVNGEHLGRLGNTAILPLTGILRMLYIREIMKSFCVSYFRRPTADGTAVPESIGMCG